MKSLAGLCGLLAFVGLWRVLDNRPFRSASVPQFLRCPHPGAANPGALPGLNERQGESGSEDLGPSHLLVHLLLAQLLPEGQGDGWGGEGCGRHEDSNKRS